MCSDLTHGPPRALTIARMMPQHRHTADPHAAWGITAGGYLIGCTRSLPGMQQAVQSLTPRHSCPMPTMRADAGYKGASDMYIDTNVQLAIATAKQVRLRCRC